VRASLPTALPTAAVGVSFGLLAAPALGSWPTVAMSALVWSGTAQFAAVGALLGGAGPAVASGTGLLANARYLPMGFAVAPSMTGGPVRRAGLGALLADASFAIGSRGGGRFDVAAMAWATPVQYLAWLIGTVVGAVGAGSVGDPQRWGLDVLFPVFYLSLLLPELGLRRPRRERGPLRRRALLPAAVAAATTVALTPVTPPGVPVLAAAPAALLGLRPPRPSGPRVRG